MNQNTDYERFTREVYRQLSELEGIKTICIEHNIPLTGKSGCKHQIDVYWEYEHLEVKHKVAIECKNYSHTLSIGKVRDFCGVLSDLEDVTGIMVTKKGYQKGAKKYAAHYGINLKELRTPDESDGLIGQIEINIDLAIRRRVFLVDEIWAKDNDFNLPCIKNFLARFMDDKEWLQSDYIPLQTLPDAKILNKDRDVITTFHELEDKLPPEGTVEEYVFPFDDAYIDCQEGFVKIREVKYLYIKERNTNVFGLEARDFVKAILKDALNGEQKLLGKYV